MKRKNGKQQLTPARRYETAIHEAGHAVVALHYGFKLRKRDCMVLRDCEDGSTYFTVRPGNAIHDAVAGMAGAAADMLNGRGFSRSYDTSCSDRKQVERNLTSVRIGRPRNRSDAAWKEWKVRNIKADNVRMHVVLACQGQAETILEKRWSTVTALARALAARGRLDRDEVESIYVGRS